MRNAHGRAMHSNACAEACQAPGPQNPPVGPPPQNPLSWGRAEQLGKAARAAWVTTNGQWLIQQ
eukprot:10614348-Alexandrium_andersonii.AAC.1